MGEYATRFKGRGEGRGRFREVHFTLLTSHLLSLLSLYESRNSR